MTRFSPLVVAFHVVPHLPFGLVLGVADLAADATWACRGRHVRLLESNHRRILGRAPTRRETRAAVRSHFRAYAEQFALAGLTAQDVEDRVEFPWLERFRDLTQDGPVILALTHSGNYDLAAASAGRHGLGVLAVAEKVDPPELFDAFVRYREGLGMQIIAAEKGHPVFPDLVARARGRHAVVPLLADRDITGSGIEVDVGGHRALVAAGPAALAERLGRPVFAGHLHYARSGRRWRVVVEFVGPVAPPGPTAERTGVETHTQAWVDAVLPLLRRHVRDWHMMQPVFVEDLDPDRLARARERHRRQEEGADPA